MGLGCQLFMHDILQHRVSRISCIARHGYFYGLSNNSKHAVLCCAVVLCQVLYQDEPLVQLLVSCQAHNYLEFKLVEGK